MLEFRVFENKKTGIIKIIQVEPVFRDICTFVDDPFISCLSGDIVDFLNDKYVDKNINEEWFYPDREARIKYHKEQLKILENEKPVCYTEHGNGVIL